MTLECLKTHHTWDDFTKEVVATLTIGKRYEILNVEDFLKNDERWYSLRDDMGVIGDYHYSKFSCLREEIRNNKLKELLE
jgi:hypothetical protein